MNWRVVFSTCCFSLMTFLSGNAQVTIELENPSFEGVPHQGQSNLGGQLNTISGSVNPFQPIRGWTDCGFKTETPPDLHGANTDFFGVNRTPQDGASFLGMVVRYNDSWERISQKLSRPLEAGKCYKMSVYLARDLSYKSPTRDNQQYEEDFTKPCVLKIHGGNGFCAAHELLAESVPIRNSEWRRYDFIFKPKKSWLFIEFEAFYQTPTLFPYNGNILLDNVSAITVIPCPDEPIAPVEPEPPMVAQVDTPPINPPVTRVNPEQPIKTPQKESPKEKVKTNPEVADNKLLKELDAKTIREGQVIQIEKLYFQADKANITADSYDVLDEVYDFLSENSQVTVEIGGHTNNRPPHQFCDSLSTARAESVADYLVRRGIQDERIKAKGYGKRKPIASNQTISGRKRNQRVEIKILSLDGTEG